MPPLQTLVPHTLAAQFMAQADPAELDQLPAELRERFPGVVDDLRTGVIDEVPDAVLDQLPGGVVDAIPDSLLASQVNMTFVIVLVAIGLVAAAGFFWGVTKAAMKAALFFAVVAAIAAVALYVQF